MKSDGAHTTALTQWMNTLTGYVQSARPDLTNRQMALLLQVYVSPGPHTVRGLAERLRVSKPVVTRALNTLGAFGYLRRQKDHADLRNVFIERTDAGDDFLREFGQLIRQAGVDGGAGVSRLGVRDHAINGGVRAAA